VWYNKDNERGSNPPKREVIKMKEMYTVRAESTIHSVVDPRGGMYPRDYYLIVEAENELEAVEEAKAQVIAGALIQGRDEEVTVTRVEKLADVRAQQEKERAEKEEKERQAKEKKLATERKKAEALGMTVEEYRKDKANKAYCRRLEREIAELERQLKEKKRKLAERRGE
jgi:hypothetical protein